MPAPTRSSLGGYYAWLTAYAHVSGARRSGSRSVHRQLRSDAGMISHDVVHDRILDALRTCGVPQAPVVLDAGCGLGATSLYLWPRLGGQYVGVTLSDAQRRHATRAALARGAGGDCRFVVRDFDDDLSDLLPGGVDIVIAIESLAHTSRPARSLARLAAHLRPGGHLVVVDDMPAAHLAGDDSDFRAFRTGWLCPSPLSAQALAQACADVALVVRIDDDLTGRMPQRAPSALARRWRVASMGRLVTARTPFAVPVASWHGGLALERLYARGLMQYRMCVAQRTPA